MSDELTADESQAPEGFSLEGEQSRQTDAATDGLVAHANPAEPDVDSPVNGVSGAADNDDDDAIEDPDRDPLEDI